MLSVKNRNITDLAVASLGIKIDDSEKAIVLNEVSSLPKESWYRCEFRNCDLLLVYGGDNVLEKNQLNWTEAAQQCPALKTLIDKLLHPFFTIRPRIIILKTKPSEELNWHVDCNKEELESFQPKLRCLIAGKKDDLYFLSKGNEKIKAPVTSDVYYMSGAYIHALKNNNSEERYVVCFGSPWGEEHLKESFVHLLKNVPEESLLWSDKLNLADRASFVRIPKKHGLTSYGTL